MKLIKTKIKCDCSCHKGDDAIMHSSDCCFGGYIYSYEEVNEDNNALPKKSLLDNFNVIVPEEYNTLKTK
jgi:hypothetical protein